MKDSRILKGKICEFFNTDSAIRARIANYVLENLKKGTKSVALCFRGDFATLYYRCHQLLRIRNSKNGIIGEFDFRHARFTENYREIRAKLKDMGVDDTDFSDAPTEQGKSIGKRYVRFPLAQFSAEKLEEVLEIYKGLIDDFINPEKCIYAFDPKEVCRKSHNIEKDRQQQLYAAYFQDEDFLYYDIEYAEPRGGEKDGLHGRFDLLGLRKEVDGYTLLLTELKSSPKALGGNSGIGEHEKDYLKYLNSPYMKIRKKEACETVRLINEIFNRATFSDLNEENIKQVKIKFVFSDKVINYGKRYCPSDSRIEKTFLDGDKEKPY